MKLSDKSGKLLRILGITGWGLLSSEIAIGGVPNGTWLSQPQIRFYSSTNSISQIMRDIQQQRYRFVFLDVRGVSDKVQQQVTEKAREYKLIPIVWVQSPQYRSLTVADLIYEARHGDGIQIDDHFFAHYSRDTFESLSFQYKKLIFCSIQPFQAALVEKLRCNQLDVQCYTTNQFGGCIRLADRLNAVVSLSDKDTFRYREQLGVRRFNVFLWPYIAGNREQGTGNRGEKLDFQGNLPSPTCPSRLGDCYNYRSWERSFPEKFGIGQFLIRTFGNLL